MKIQTASRYELVSSGVPGKYYPGPGLPPDAAPYDWEDALLGYLEDGITPGGFLTAILENNLTESVIKADRRRVWQIVPIVQWLLAEAVPESWGGPEKVRAWIKYCWEGE